MKVMSIIRKDLKTILSDKKALAIIIAMPLIIMIILSSALRGMFDGTGGWSIDRLNIAIVRQYDKNEDSLRFDKALKEGILARGVGKEAAEELRAAANDIDPEKIFFEDFLGSEELAKIIAYREEKEERAVEMLNNGEISAVVILPKDFIYDMKINLLTPFRNKINIRMLTHPDRSMSGQIVRSVMEAYSDSMTLVISGKNVLLETAIGHNLMEDGFKEMKETLDGITKVIEGIRTDMYGIEAKERKAVQSSDYYAASMLAMFILFAASHGGRMLLEEKDNITYQRMIIAGTPRLGILAGKFFTVFFIALLQISIMITFSYFVLKVQWGSAFPVVLISLCAAFAVAGIGSMLAAATYRAGNYKMANIFETVVIQAMAVLGGSFFPVDILPSMMQKLSFLSISGVVLNAYLKIMMGYGISAIMSNIATLAVIGFLSAMLSVLMIKGNGGVKYAQHNKAKTVRA